MDVAAALWSLSTILSFLSSDQVTATSSLHRPLLPINHLRPRFSSAGHPVAGVSCESWRFGVETNNVRGWKTIPGSCEGYVGNYMLGDRYRKDSAVVVDEAIGYASGLKLGNDGKDVWVFDVDETTLSNLPYYAQHGFGATLFNDTSFEEWVNQKSAPALPETLRLYNKLLSLRIRPLFLTGRRETQRQVTVANLKKAGYRNWEKLLLKGANASGKTAVTFKSAERQKLVDEGYRIVGNIGDQWSDILGSPEGDRTFKLPDPMYYLP